MVTETVAFAQHLLSDLGLSPRHGSGLEQSRKVNEGRMRRRPTTRELAEKDERLSPEWRRELARRVADSRNPIRYVVFSDITGDGRWRLWLDVSGDGYGMSVNQATLFKRKHIARAVAKMYSEGRKNGLLIAKITTKNGKRRILKCEKAGHRTTSYREYAKAHLKKIKKRFHSKVPDDNL